MEDKLVGAKVSTDQVCHDGHVITSRGLGTAIPFALEIIKTFQGDAAADKISNESPVGAGLLGAKRNQTVTINIPAGTIRYKVMSIKKM